MIHDDVLASVAGMATLESYGVVGMASRRVNDGLAVLLQRDHATRGVRISPVDGADDNLYAVDLYVIIGYGVKIGEVGKSIVRNVSQALLEAVGKAPHKVTVHVEGVRK